MVNYNTRAERKENERKNKNTNILLGVLLGTMTLVLMGMIVLSTIIRTVEVDGMSMYATLKPKQELTYVKAKPLSIKPKRFSIVIVEPENKGEDNYVKRLIGMGGDTIEYKDDVLYINGIRYEEPYLDELRAENNQKLMMDFKVKVPEGQVYVMGDNRLNSKDSRSFGSISEKSIIGVKAPFTL